MDGKGVTIGDLTNAEETTMGARSCVWGGNGLLHAGTAQDETDAELRAAMSNARVEEGKVLAGTGC